MLALALLQIVAQAPSPARVESPSTLTETEARATAAPALARRVLGAAGDAMVEATVLGSWRAPFGGGIDSAARPIAAARARLCTAKTINAVFLASAGSGEANLPHHVVGLEPGVRYRLLDHAAYPARDCPASSPALATAERPGFFRLHCDWASCDHPDTAMLVAELVDAANRRLSEPGFARCRPSQAMGQYCPTATRRAVRAFATGFPDLSVHPCQKAPERFCIVAYVPPSDPRAQLSVEIETTLPANPALPPQRWDATGVSIVMHPPVDVN